MAGNVETMNPLLDGIGVGPGGMESIADPIPVTGATGDEIQVVETSTDCEDCADAMSGATSEPVEVRGELRPAGEVMAELAPGATLTAGDLVLVATTVTPIP